MNDKQKMEATHTSIVNGLLFIDGIKSLDIKQQTVYNLLRKYLGECTGLISELITIEENTLDDILDNEQSFMGSTIKGILRKVSSEDERVSKIKDIESYIIDDVFYYVNDRDSEIVTTRDLAMSPYVAKK
jgi:hypothetical protein